jgi:P-type Ca2+ transporter type 2C
MEKNHHSISGEKALSDLDSNLQGLSEKEAQKRLVKYGPNKIIEQKRISKFFIFFSQFNNILIYILLLASLISFLFKENVDAIVILAAVFLNTIIGYFQENKAQSDLSKLKHYIKQQVFVRREGRQYLLDIENLVPGDIILIQSGSRIAADCKILEANELKCQEAALTGESIAVDKSSEKVSVGAVIGDRSSMLYTSTNVVRGNAVALVISTGMDTEIGKIAGYISETEDEATPLQIRLKKLGHIIGIFSLAACALIFILGIILGRSALEMFLISVAIAVSSIPEGLPVAITVILAIGMQRILKKKALVRRLVAAETLGSTTVICTDKTGTLTVGQMAVSDIILDNEIVDILSKKGQTLSEGVKEVLRVGFLCNDAFLEDQKSSEESLKELKISGSPTDRALLSAGLDLGFSLKEEKKNYPKLDEVTFDSAKKYMMTLHANSKEQTNDRIIFCKGAPEIVIERCSFINTKNGVKKLTAKEKEKIIETQNHFTSKGLRLLAVAERRISSKILKDDLDDNFEQLVLLGLIALKDPLRKTSKETIKICQQAGIRPIIITGDHKLTARAVAGEVGLKIAAENILIGEDLDKLNDDDLREKVKKVSLYARVSPHHKLRIIKALQENNEVVAMAGDGINDAPAIQMADIGIALGSGTDIAKETAEIVLLENDFSVIVQAVKQGRIIFDNLRKIIVYLLSDSFSGMLLIIAAIALGLPLPLIPAQILWINIVNDSLPNFALAFEKGDKDIMKRKPLKKNEPILDKEMKFLIFVIGVFTDIGLLALFIILMRTGHDIEHVRTYMFAALGIDSLIYVYSCKNLKRQIWNYKLFDNKLLVLGTTISLFMLMAGIYFPFFQKALRTIPLGMEGWLIMLGVAVFEVVSIEFGKWLFIHKRFGRDKK